MSKKEEIKVLKKTIEAHGGFSEADAEEKAAHIEEVTEELLEGKPEIAEEIIKKIVAIPEERARGRDGYRGRGKTREQIVAEWVPKTALGRDVKSGKIKDIDEIISTGKKILEAEIIDTLVSTNSDLLAIGQSKGKFGGGKRRAWRQTQRKTKEGNIPSFSTLAVIGDEKGHVGIGSGKAKETLPARDKAIRKAKLAIFKVERGCSSFDFHSYEPHTIPSIIKGKGGGVRITLMPAPQGTGLVVADELKKVLKLAGIRDIYSKTFGKKRTTFNIVKACIDALKKTSKPLNTI